MLGGNGDKLTRPPHEIQVPLEIGRKDPGVLVITEQAAGVLEQLTDRDVLPVGDQPRQPTLHRITQPKSVLADKLQHHCGGEGLGHTPDLVAVTRPHRPLRPKLGQAAGPTPPLPPVPGQPNGARHPPGDQFIQQPLELWAWQLSLAGQGACRRRRRGRHNQQHGKHQRHQPAATQLTAQCRTYWAWRW
jgi:hypothetical protein